LLTDEPSAPLQSAVDHEVRLHLATSLESDNPVDLDRKTLAQCAIVTAALLLYPLPGNVTDVLPQP
jgi:hypothetical protein